MAVKEIMYFIVSFVDTEEVEVVPTIWVRDGVCLWPPYEAERVQRAAKHLEQPQESWSAYKVKVMYKANTYREGCHKLSLAQQTELQSEAVPDSLMPPKRQKKRDRALVDGYDPDEEAETKELRPSLLGQSQNQPPDLTQSAETSRTSLSKTGPASEWRENTHQISQQPPSSCDPFIASLLHEILTKQDILMEQQGTIMRIVQDLKANDVSETTEANHFSQEQCPIEDSFEDSAYLERYPETSVKVETYSGNEDNEMARKDNEYHPVRMRKKGIPCGPRCGNKCMEKILPVRRKEIFEAYQDMSRSDRWAFVFHSVTQSVKIRHANRRPSKSLRFHLKNSLGQPQEVCRSFYLTTLGYSSKSKHIIANVMTSGAVPPPDARELYRKIDDSLICEHIKSYNPTVGYSKCEHAKGRLYLPSNVTIKMMHEDYKGKCSMPCSYPTYVKAIRNMNIFSSKLNGKKCKECNIHVKTKHL